MKLVVRLSRAVWRAPAANLFPRDRPAGLWSFSGMARLTPKEIKAGLETVPEWGRKGKNLHRVYQFEDFPAAIRFVDKVAREAEKAWHHPDIDIRWNKVTLTLTTHDEGGLTEKDFDLARKFDAKV